MIRKTFHEYSFLQYKHTKLENKINKQKQKIYKTNLSEEIFKYRYINVLII